MLTSQHPGPWHLYINRPDNRELHILEVKQKYLQEQLTYENQLSQTIYMQNMLSIQPKGGGKGVVEDIDNTLNEFVDNDYVEDYLV
jgi:hypothetical protein